MKVELLFTFYIFTHTIKCLNAFCITFFYYKCGCEKKTIIIALGK